MMMCAICWRSFRLRALAGFIVLYPDPWPKKRHHERRIVNADTLKQFHALLKPDGVFLFASDIDDYVEWTLREVRGAWRVWIGWQFV